MAANASQDRSYDNAVSGYYGDAASQRRDVRAGENNANNADRNFSYGEGVEGSNRAIDAQIESGNFDLEQKKLLSGLSTALAEATDPAEQTEIKRQLLAYGIDVDAATRKTKTGALTDRQRFESLPREHRLTGAAPQSSLDQSGLTLGYQSSDARRVRWQSEP